MKQGRGVDVVADDAEGEDCEGEGVAAAVGVAEEVGYCFVVVFCVGGMLVGLWGWCLGY